MRQSVKVTALIAVLALLTAGATIGFSAFTGGAPEAKTDILKFDVAEDATRFAFDESPVFDDGFPAYGNAFVTSGYIYEHGTLGETDGVLPDGSPEFPEKLIGSWICRGWFIGDGAHTESGAWVVTTQYYELGDEDGAETIVTDGVEIADVGKEVSRAITGGTGSFSNARGQGTQELLGFNESEGVNLRFELEVKTRP